MDWTSFKYTLYYNANVYNIIYKPTLLIFAELTTAKKLVQFIGIIAYINTYIYKCTQFKYWLDLLLIKPNVH